MTSFSSIAREDAIEHMPIRVRDETEQSAHRFCHDFCGFCRARGRKVEP
jgi:hypothetical protein